MLVIQVIGVPFYHTVTFRLEQCKAKLLRERLRDVDLQTQVTGSLRRLMPIDGRNYDPRNSCFNPLPDTSSKYLLFKIVDRAQL